MPSQLPLADPRDPPPTDGRLPREVLADIGRQPFGMYVHVPFCTTRCGYCDFNTYTADELGDGVSRGSYADLVLREIRLAADVLGDAARPVETVFRPAVRGHVERDQAARRAAALHDIGGTLVRRKGQAVRAADLVRRDRQHAGRAVDPVDMGRQLGLRAFAFVVAEDAELGVGEPDGAVARHHDVVRGVEAACPDS